MTRAEVHYGNGGTQVRNSQTAIGMVTATSFGLGTLRHAVSCWQDSLAKYEYKHLGKTEKRLTLPLVIAAVTAGARTPAIEPTVLVRPLREPARFGAMSCSEISEPVFIGPWKPTAMHIKTMATTSLQLTHIMAKRHAAEEYRAAKRKENVCLPKK